MKVDKILVIGCGGTGGFLIPALARYLITIKFDGDFILADGDNYSESNVERQMFAASKVGNNKAAYQAAAIKSQIGETLYHLWSEPKYLSKKDVEEEVDENTVVFNCADNLAIRKHVEDHIQTLDCAAHICCGNEMTTGQVQISYRLKGKNVTPSIYERYPELNSDNDDRAEMSCEEIAELPSGGQVITANMMSASIALSAFMALTKKSKAYAHGTALGYDTIEFNCLQNAFARHSNLTPILS